jgi:hypothetical protein
MQPVANYRRIQYSGKENLHLEESIDTHILGFVKLIETKYLSDSSHARPLDFAAKAQFLTLDVITDVAFGEPFGDLAADEDVHEYIHTIEKMLPVAIWVTVFPSLIDLIAVSWIGKRVLPSSGDNIGLGKAMGFVLLPFATLVHPHGFSWGAEFLLICGVF